MTTDAPPASASPTRAARLSLPQVSGATIGWTLVFAVIGAVYLGARIVSWQLNGQFEDHDSIGYLKQIAVFSTFEWDRIEALGADVTPFYPFFAALFTLPGWSVETAARLCSLAFSGVLFVSLIGIARHVGGLAAGALGLLLVALNPELIRLSHSVLTEPSFIATVYLALWVFLEQRDRLSLVHAAIVGLILGLAFLNRLEGLVFAVALPLLQAGYTVIVYQWRAPVKRLLLWSGVCYLAFAASTAPQVWYVSAQLGQFAINGRQLPASLLYNRPDGMNYEQKFYGLDYSPSQVNWGYVEDNPAVLAELASSPPDILQYVRRLVENLGALNHRQLGVLIGVAALSFVAVSIVLQLQERRYSLLFLSFGFIAVGLAGPVLHNVVTRHIAVVAPLLLLITGDGIMRTARRATASLGAARLAVPLGIGLAACVLAASVLPLYRLYVLPDTVNSEYRLSELQPVIARVERIAATEQRTPRIVARKTYLSHLVGDVAHFPLPYTDLAGLETYMKMNEIDFLFLGEDPERPFTAAFADSNPPPDFRLLYRSPPSAEFAYELYRYEPRTSSGW